MTTLLGYSHRYRVGSQEAWALRKGEGLGEGASEERNRLRRAGRRPHVGACGKTNMYGRNGQASCGPSLDLYQYPSSVVPLTVPVYTTYEGGTDRVFRNVGT